MAVRRRARTNASQSASGIRGDPRNCGTRPVEADERQRVERCGCRRQKILGKARWQIGAPDVVFHGVVHANFGNFLVFNFSCI
jgi:hypothetical protein